MTTDQYMTGHQTDVSNFKQISAGTCIVDCCQRRLTKPFYWREFDVCSKAPVIRIRSVLSPIDGL